MSSAANSLNIQLEKAIEARALLFDAPHQTAFRLFNGFTEGEPNLVVDLYASTLVIHNYAEDPTQGKALVEQAITFLRNKLSWLRAGILKTRNGETLEERRGRLRLIASEDGREGSVAINQDARVYATLLEAGQVFTHALPPNRHAWIQLARGTLRLNGLELKQGDGAAVRGESDLTIETHDQAELLLFDLA